jgi:hypothetical protein
MLPAGSAGEQQIGDVDAADEQHRANGGEEHEKRATARPGEVRPQADNTGAESDVIRRLPADGLLKRVHLRHCLRKGDAGLEASDAEVIVVAFDFGKPGGGPAEGDEGFDRPASGTVHGVHQPRRGQHEAGGQDADDGVGPAVQRDGATDDVGIGGEAAAPETFRENDNVMVRLLFCRQQGSAKNGLDAEQRKEVGGVLRDADDLRRAAAERHGAKAERGEALEGLRVLPPVEEMVGVDRQIAEAVRPGMDFLAQRDELLRLYVIGHAQQHVAHDGEHDDVGADAEGEGKKSGRAESRTSAQLTNGKAQLAEKSVHGRDVLLMRPGNRCPDTQL